MGGGGVKGAWQGCLAVFGGSKRVLRGIKGFWRV